MLVIAAWGRSTANFFPQDTLLKRRVARSVDVVDVIGLLVYGDGWQPFRNAGPLQLNRDGLFRIALDGLYGTAIHAIFITERFQRERNFSNGLD